MRNIPNHALCSSMATIASHVKTTAQAHLESLLQLLQLGRCLLPFSLQGAEEALQLSTSQMHLAPALAPFPVTSVACQGELLHVSKQLTRDG